jgi:hypothetical protein
MKGFIVCKMCFIFAYFVLMLLQIKMELSNPCWLSFLHGASVTFCLFAIVNDVIQIVKRKE